MIKNFVIIVLFFFGLNAFAQKEKYICGWYLIESKNGEQIFDDNKDDEYLIKDLLLSYKYVKNIKLINSPIRPFKQIQLVFNDEGKLIWEKLTDDLSKKNKQICFIYNDKVLIIVGISTKISTGKVSFGTVDYDLETLYSELSILISE